MGSPYGICRIRLDGDWRPDLPETDWQNLSARSPDGMRLALVRWDTPGNQPGFRLYVLDSLARQVSVSERFPGCCYRLWWRDDQRIAWEAFPEGQGVYDVGTEA